MPRKLVQLVHFPPTHQISTRCTKEGNISPRFNFSSLTSSSSSLLGNISHREENYLLVLISPQPLLPSPSTSQSPSASQIICRKQRQVVTTTIIIINVIMMIIVMINTMITMMITLAMAKTRQWFGMCERASSTPPLSPWARHSPLLRTYSSKISF